MIRVAALLEIATRDAALALFQRAPGTLYDPAAEATGIGYEAGGTPLTGRRLGVDDDGAAAVTWDTPTVWPASTIEARYVVLYDRASGMVLRLDSLPESERKSRNGAFVVTLPEQVITLREG